MIDPVPNTRVGCPLGTASLVNTLLARNKSYPKTAGIMLQQYKTKIWLERWDKTNQIWEKI